MTQTRARGSSATRPIIVMLDAARGLAPSVLDPGAQVTDLCGSHRFADFKLAQDNERAPLCDLFDRISPLPELPFAVGAYPEWNRTRPFLTGQHLWSVPSGMSSLRQVDEKALIDDVLFVFMGLTGAYLQPVFTQHKDRHQEIHFELKAVVDGSCQELLQRILPLCEAVVVVQRFVETRSGMEYGTVCHAVAASMQSMVDDWMLLVTQLESQLKNDKLTLQTLWFYVQPAMSVMLVLAEICRQTAAQELQGTELLNLLHAKMKQMSGSQNAEALLRKLLEAAAVPYFEILERWLCEGVIQDPYSEFMIEEDPHVQTTMTTAELQSAYWQTRYRIRKTFLSLNGEIISVHCVPSFLHQHADLILTTGKYLNAIRECGRRVERPLASDEHPVFDASCAYLRLIQKAHKLASQAFLDMFMKDLKLIDWLRGLKHFFLMDKGDMIGHLMDIAEEELEKVASQVVVNRMQSLLELAFKTSSLPSEINTEPLQVELDHRSLVDLSVCLRQPQRMPRASIRNRQSVTFASARIGDASGTSRASYLAEELRGWDIFMINFRIEWPMMLIVPPKLMQMYQLIFKQLFVLKRTEYQLGKAWKALQKTRNLTDRSLDGVLRLAEGTCHLMQHTVQQYLRHLTVHTVEPRWRGMEAALLKAHDVDRVIEIHNSFVEKILWQSLLRKVKGVKELDHVISESLAYAAFITSTLNVEGWMPPSSSTTTAKPAELTAERRRILSVKIESALKSGNFPERVVRCRTDYLAKLNQLVRTLMDYCDIEGGDQPRHGTEEDVHSREDLDKLMNLVEMLKPC